MALDGLLRFNTKITRYIQQDKGDAVLKVHANDIVKAVKAQLAAGLDGNGNPIYLMRDGQKRYNYAFATAFDKVRRGIGLGAVTSRITLYKHGTFYSSLYLETRRNGYFEILSRDPKFELIEMRSGEDLLKLSPQITSFLLRQEIAAELQAGINAIFFDQL